MRKKGSGPRIEKARQGVARIHSGNPTTLAPTLDHEEIARLAYSYWQARACETGSPEEDWFRAENELRSRRTGSEA